MASLAEKISFLSNPAPVVLDPEDDVNTETVAKVEKNTNDCEALFNRSELRSKAATLLDDCDPAYVGKKISRKSLDGIFHDDPKDDLESSKSYDSDSSNEEDEEMDGSDDDDDDDDDDNDDNDDDVAGNLKAFKERLNKEINSDVESDIEESDEVKESDDSEDVEISHDISNKFSNIGFMSQKEKGNCVKAQKELMNKLYESRIKLQKPLISFNKLPQGETYNKCKMKAEKEFEKNGNLACDKLKKFLNKCINIEEKILQRAPEFKNQVKKEVENQSDEEIPSDTDEEMKVEPKQEPEKCKRKFLKRKLTCDEYSELLSKRHEALIPYKHAVIQKWDEKTKLSSGKITQKSFAAFESSALKQIKQILQDESRLIKRTQLKRSLYRVLGKPDVSENKVEEGTQNNESKSKQDMLLRDYDEEIFDDNDFYRQFIKEVIESNSAGINPDVLRKQIEIQSVRNKMKKKVDTKASKGRKLRYEIHPKLVGFMRRKKTCTISDEARDNLIKNMCGKSYSK